MDAQLRTAAVLVIAGLLMLFLGLVPGMPTLLVTAGLLAVMLGIVIGLVWIAEHSGG